MRAQDLVVTIKMDDLVVARIDLAIHEIKFKMRWFNCQFSAIRRFLHRREYIAARTLLDNERVRVAELEVLDRERREATAV